MRGTYVALFAVLALVIIFIGIGIIYTFIGSDDATDIDDSSDSNIDSPPLPGADTCMSLGCDVDEIYVGSVNSDKYYSCDCHYADRILSENIICFKSDSDATSKGYVKVEDC